MFKFNVGSWDRWLRIIVGLGVVSLNFWGPRTAWGWIGILPIVTGLFRFCPAYTLFGIATCKKS